MEKHHARCQFVHILAPFSPGLYKGLLNLGLAHAQSGHPLGQHLLLPQIHGECTHHGNLAEGLINLKAADNPVVISPKAPPGGSHLAVQVRRRRRDSAMEHQAAPGRVPSLANNRALW
jgi:hypothetical protein